MTRRTVFSPPSIIYCRSDVNIIVVFSISSLTKTVLCGRHADKILNETEQLLLLYNCLTCSCLHNTMY